MNFNVLDGQFLISLNGAGFFTSKNVHCGRFCTKRNRDDTATYGHQMFGAAVVHCDRSEGISGLPEVYTQRRRSGSESERLGTLRGKALHLEPSPRLSEAKGRHPSGRADIDRTACQIAEIARFSLFPKGSRPTSESSGRGGPTATVLPAGSAGWAPSR